MSIYTKQDIIKQLENMNAPKDSIVLMHSSLRAVGQVEGGAKALLDTLIEYFTADGGLFCVPSHTWHNFGKEIMLDMTTSDNCLGAFSTVALQDPRAVRTESPIHSMVVFGEKARVDEFVADEKNIKSTTAPDSCYGKLFSQGGQVLLVGVNHSRNTYLHAVAEILNLPNRMASDYSQVKIKRKNGEIIDRKIKFYHNDYTDDLSCRFVKYETAFRYHHAITDGFIGNAPTQLCDARKMKETVELIFKNSDGADPLIDEKPIPQKWYCLT